jgi:hypothetical protein
LLIAIAPAPLPLPLKFDALAPEALAVLQH